MKKTALFILLFCICSVGFSQEKFVDWVMAGIEYHDAGKFKEAISAYEKALEIDPKSSSVHYAMAVSYLGLKDFQQSLKHCDVVLKQQDAHMVEVYVLKGSILDNLGKYSEAIKLFKKGIKQFKGEYLLHFNLGIAYLNTRKFEKAEESFKTAVMLNPTHAGSHYVLCIMNEDAENITETLLSGYFFLLVEPETERSGLVRSSILNLLKGNVVETPGEGSGFTVLVPESSMKDAGDRFSVVEFAISLSAVRVKTDTAKKLSEQEVFINQTQSFFSMLSEMKTEEDKGIWWELYVDLFSKILSAGHIETYCHYISGASVEESKDWLEANETKLDEFGSFLRDNFFAEENEK